MVIGVAAVWLDRVASAPIFRAGVPLRRCLPGYMAPGADGVLRGAAKDIHRKAQSDNARETRSLKYRQGGHVGGSHH
jgi:hypothetical protein